LRGIEEDTDMDRIEAMAIQIGNIVRVNCERGPLARARVFEGLNALGLVADMVINAIPEDREKDIARKFLIEVIRLGKEKLS
jgi:hypothetical protein